MELIGRRGLEVRLSYFHTDFLGEPFADSLGKWFGLSDSQLLEVLPSLVNFNASQRSLGFV